MKEKMWKAIKFIGEESYRLWVKFTSRKFIKGMIVVGSTVYLKMQGKLDDWPFIVGILVPLGFYDGVNILKEKLGK